MKKSLVVALWEESKGMAEGLENSPNIGSVVLRTSQEINSFLSYPTAEDLQFPIFGFWGEQGLIWG